MLADYDSGDFRNSIREPCADLHRETVVSTLFRSESKGKSDRDQNVVQSSRDNENLHKILECAVREEKLAQQKLNEAEAEVEARNWEKRNSDMLVKRSIRSSSPNDYS